MLPSNLGHIFDGPLHHAPGSTAVIQDDTILTFETLEARCNQIANGLSSLGVAPGTRVALMFDNDYRYFEALFGPMRLGAVSVPLNTKTADDASA